MTLLTSPQLGPILFVILVFVGIGVFTLARSLILAGACVYEYRQHKRRGGRLTFRGFLEAFGVRNMLERHEWIRPQ